MSSSIVGCDAGKNYMFLEIHNWWLEYEVVAKNCKFFHISYRCKVEQPATQQRNGINSETEMCM